MRLFGLSRSAGPSAEPGLILVQIDGLAREQFEAALERGRLPFLRRLRKREGYRVHSFYSGVPSTTPSVQGELFYGVRPAVPAFSFFRHREGRIVKMFDTDVVLDLERELGARGRPLLEGGSAYSNIYTGGADEAHFCSATIGWGNAIKAANPFKLAVLTAMHFPSVLRVMVLAPLELGLAVIDFFRGTSSGFDIVKELKFVPTRVLVCILLRELITIGAMIDAARGLPVIHLNYLGYDEQAHRRGPGSEFAHWTLKGIDFCVRRLYVSSRRSARRDYDVWVYSDHGQERTTPYPVERGVPLREAVETIFASFSAPAEQQNDGTQRIGSQRARYLGGSHPGRFLPREPVIEPLPDGSRYTLAAMGPVGHINFGRDVDRTRLPEFAGRLVAEAGVPAVLMLDGPGRVLARTGQGVLVLPGDGAALLGNSHPFLAEVEAELIELCSHPDAGELVLLGWRTGGRPMSFPIESGAHAGPGPNETHAFALLPFDAPIDPELREGYLRPLTLREAAFRHLGRLEGIRPITRPLDEPAPEAIRVLTYNVRRCLGRDGRVSTRRIARIIGRYHPDVICLQDLEARRDEGGASEQAEAIAAALKTDFHLHGALFVEGGSGGTAILSRFPIRSVPCGALPPASGRKGEGCDTMRAEFDLGAGRIQLIHVRLSPGRREREAQLDALGSADWLGEAPVAVPLLVCGDFGATSRVGVWNRRGGLVDAREDVSEGPGRPRRLRSRVYHSAALEVIHVEAPADEQIRIATDQSPLIVDIRNPWSKPGGAQRSSAPAGRQEASRSC